MENCEKINNVNENSNYIEEVEKDDLNQKIESIKLEEIDNKECILSIYQFDHKDKNPYKSLCKIKIENHSETIFGLGFLLKFVIDQGYFYCLVSYDHVINSNIINNNNIISMYFNNELKSSNIKSDRNKRYVKSFIDINLDITVIEILGEDKIPGDYFSNDEFEIDNNRLINSQIYIPLYEKEKETNVKGKIIKINKYEFIYSANGEYDSLVCPIFLENSTDVFGIHKGNIENKTEKKGYLIYTLIDLIKSDINKIRNNGKYINGKYIWEDGKYYLGEIKDNIPNGKGIKYYSNGNIQYEGDFKDGKFEGNGKFYYDDGDYFIGEYKYGLRNGKGKKYLKNGNLCFEGEYINGKAEGYGKDIWEDGEYYIGQYKNGIMNGKGIYYYSNGKIKYEGEYVNGKYEGNGKYIWEDGIYYIGQEKNGLMHGKGTLYYSNGNIKYEGDFINDVYEGNGKYIWEDGEYYIGQWKNGLRHGKGIEYSKKGNIMYEGDWINSKYV